MGCVSIGALPEGGLWTSDVVAGEFLIYLREQRHGLLGSGVSYDGGLWVRDLVARVLVDLREWCDDFLGSVVSFCLSSLGFLMEF